MKKLASAVALVIVSSLLPLSSYAQTSSDDSSVGTTKAQRKAARKEARAKRNAELKKLEAAGYNPARNDDTTYPGDIQQAERKAAASN